MSHQNRRKMILKIIPIQKVLLLFVAVDCLILFVYFRPEELNHLIRHHYQTMSMMMNLNLDLNRTLKKRPSLKRVKIVSW